MRPASWCLAVVLLLAACARSPYKGFKRVADGIDLRLHVIGDGEAVPTDSDSTLLRVRIARLNDAPGSLFSTERRYALRDTGAFARAIFRRIHQGDSMSVIAIAGAVPWWLLAPEVARPPADTTHVRLELSLRELLTPARMREEQARLRDADPEGYQQRALARVLDSTWVSWGDQVHYKMDRLSTDTTTIRSGDIVTLHYQGRFTDGRVFDDTRRAGQPMTFRLGDPDQVIKGLEVAAHLLHKGDRATFAITYPLAFGERGSSTGLVPPFTPVVYSVEVVEVQRPSLP